MLATPFWSGIGTIFLCRTDGTIEKVINLGKLCSIDIGPGTCLCEFIDENSSEKFRKMMEEIEIRKIAVNWEFNVSDGKNITTFIYGGFKTGNDVYLFGLPDRSGVDSLYEFMIDYSTMKELDLSDLIMDKESYIKGCMEKEQSLFDEISRLNNDLVNLQREISKKNAELKRLNELKNEFLGMASHDMRNPLITINGYADFLLDEMRGAIKDDHYEFLSSIKVTSEFLFNLVNDFLDLSVIESGKLHLNREPVEIINFIKKTVELNRPLAEKKGIDLKMETELKSMIIQIDGNKIIQVLNNLIVNAVNYSDKGSEVMVSVRSVEDQSEREEIMTNNYLPTKGVVVIVSDQGPGIGSEEMKDLFQMFKRSDRGRSFDGAGSGIGLAIAKKIVEGHHGSLWVKSRLGKGSTFHFTVPLEEGAGWSYERNGHEA